MRLRLRVYGISEKDDRIRYVGITKKAALVRLREHVAEARLRRAKGKETLFGKWLFGAADGLKIVVLEETTDARRELAWIKLLKTKGAFLFNTNETVAHNPVYRVACHECGAKFDIEDDAAGRNEPAFEGGRTRICASCDHTEGVFEFTDESGYDFVNAD